MSVSGACHVAWASCLAWGSLMQLLIIELQEDIYHDQPVFLKFVSEMGP